ncbi:hypothetical protein GBA52_024939 [Prunus armeniaca]|nr:hypothetical protein GBA52_024939 [Prunus armeniaca]
MTGQGWRTHLGNFLVTTTTHKAPVVLEFFGAVSSFSGGQIRRSMYALGDGMVG